VGGRETILLVEDETSLLNMVHLILINKGYDVLSTTSPKEALRLCDEHAGKIDMLITDLIMPEMNGRELSDELFSRFPGIKVLYMSGYTTNIIPNHGILKEGFNFIQKPFSLNALLVAVRKALNEVAI
jgi:DNA-binding NtrC family response regulator